MADHTKIEWTDATWNPVTGCSVVSPGCTNCYAMRLAGTRMKNQPSRAGLTTPSKAGTVWNGQVRFNEKWLTQPLHWSKPRMIFVCAHADLFHEAVPDAWIDQIFAVMALAPQHTFQILTKRPERMRDYFKDRAGKLARFMIDEYLIKAPISAPTGRAINLAWPVASVGDTDMPDDVTMRVWPLPNVWLGVSVEDQRRADERIPLLLDTPATIRWVSAEPLLGPVDLRSWMSNCYECGECGLRLPTMPSVERCTECGEECGPETEPLFSDGCPKCNGELEPVCPDCGYYMVYQHPDTPNLDWVVAGGESGSNARPMHPDWARSLRDQCAAAQVPFLFKQWGEWAHWTDDDFSSELAESLELEGKYEYFQRSSTDNPVHMRKIGKRAAGRLLYGTEHNGFPEPKP